MNIQEFDVKSVRPYPGNAKIHTDYQVRQIAASIQEFGFNDPVAVDENLQFIEGEGRWLAAKFLGMEKIPGIQLSHLSARQKKAYILAHNKLTLNTGYDFDKLADELTILIEEDFNIDVIGFDEHELDAILQANAGILPEDSIHVKAHERSAKLTEKERAVSMPVCRRGEVWLLGDHRLEVGEGNGQCDLLILHFQKATKEKAIRESDGIEYNNLAKDE